MPLGIRALRWEHGRPSIRGGNSQEEKRHSANDALNGPVVTAPVPRCSGDRNGARVTGPGRTRRAGGDKDSSRRGRRPRAAESRGSCRASAGPAGRGVSVTCAHATPKAHRTDVAVIANALSARPPAGHKPRDRPRTDGHVTCGGVPESGGEKTGFSGSAPGSAGTQRPCPRATRSVPPARRAPALGEKPPGPGTWQGAG